MGEEKQIIMRAGFPDPQKLELYENVSTSSYHLVAHSEGLVSMTVNLPSNVNSDVDFYFNRYIHKVVTAVNGVATLIVKAETEEDKDREFPSEVLREPGFTVSIIYKNNNNQITTNYVFFPVYTNGIGEEPLEYDDDSYIDAKIAREAAEYALEEIDDLTDTVTTLSSNLTTLSSIVETTISSLEEFEETTTSSFEDLRKWVDYGGNPIYYEIDNENRVTITTSSYIAGTTNTKYADRLYCIGALTDTQTTLEFTVNLPKRLPHPGEGKKYSIREFAFLGRGGTVDGFFRDYYPHGFRWYVFNERTQVNATLATFSGTHPASLDSISKTTTTLYDDPHLVSWNATVDTSIVPDRHGGNNSQKSFEIYHTEADCKNGCFGTYPQHYYNPSNGERVSTRQMNVHFLTSTTTTNLVTGLEWPTVDDGPYLNTDGLLICTKGNEVPLSVWQRTGDYQNTNTATAGGSFKIALDQTGIQTLRIRIQMDCGTVPPFPDEQILDPIATTASVTYPAAKYVKGVSRVLLTKANNGHYYKRWIPIDNGTGSTQVYIETGVQSEILNARWRNTVPKHGDINNTPVSICVTVLQLEIVDKPTADNS